jgi:hypothetical protein
MTETKKIDEEILFPELKVEGEVLKPWSFGKLFDLSPMLETVLDKMEAKGMDIDFTKDVIPYMAIAKLFTIATPEILKIMSITLGKSEEEIKDFDMSKGVKVAAAIYEQNKEIVKNALAPLFQKTGGQSKRKKN